MTKPISHQYSVTVALLSLLAAACGGSQQPPLPFPEPTRPPLVEEELKPDGRADVTILDLNEEPAADKKKVVVSGTLLNRGTRATRRIIVHVQALDANGKVLGETQAFATPEAIETGNSGRFRVEMDSLADVQDYHVEVLYKP